MDNKLTNKYSIQSINEVELREKLFLDDGEILAQISSGLAEVEKTKKFWEVIYAQMANEDKYNSLPITCLNWEDYPFFVCSEAKLSYIENEALIVCLKSDEAKYQNLRIEASLYQDPVHKDSCLEAFLDFSSESGEYLNFEFNPRPCLHVGIGKGRKGRRLLPAEYEHSFMLSSLPISLKTKDEWGLSFVIPQTFLQAIYGEEISLKPPYSFRANFYKCADLSENPHYLTWQPIDTAEPDYHQPKFFAELFLA